MPDHDELIGQMAAAIWTERGLSTETDWHDVDVLTAVSTVYRNLAGAAFDALKADGWEVVKLPEPTGRWAEGPEWLQGNRLGDRSGWVTWTAAGGCVMLQRIEPGELTAEEARELAAALLAAAKTAEAAQ